jgi:hypothetical protein
MTNTYVGSPWRSRFLRAPKVAFILEKRPDFVQLDALATVRLGLKTGHDKFFFLSRADSTPKDPGQEIESRSGLCHVKGLGGVWEATLSVRDLLPAILNSKASLQATPDADIGKDIDIYAVNGLSSNKRWEVVDASILYEVPRQERNEECQVRHYEEWQAGNPGSVPCLRHQDVQDRQELKLEF